MRDNLQSAHTACAPEATKTTVGVDLGDRWSRYCVLDRDGTIIEEDRVRTSAEGLERRFGCTPGTRIVLEAGTHSPLGKPPARKLWARSSRSQRAQGSDDL